MEKGKETSESMVGPKNSFARKKDPSKQESQHEKRE